jgi:hypothetical protein
LVAVEVIIKIIEIVVVADDDVENVDVIGNAIVVVVVVLV